MLLICIQAGDELDELLQKLAGQYRGTHFCRLAIPADGDVGFRRLAIDRFAGEAELLTILISTCICQRPTIASHTAIAKGDTIGLDASGEQA